MSAVLLEESCLRTSLLESTTARRMPGSRLNLTLPVKPVRRRDDLQMSVCLFQPLHQSDPGEHQSHPPARHSSPGPEGELSCGGVSVGGGVFFYLFFCEWG